MDFRPEQATVEGRWKALLDVATTWVPSGVPLNRPAWLCPEKAKTHGSPNPCLVWDGRRGADAQGKTELLLVVTFIRRNHLEQPRAN